MTFKTLGPNISSFVTYVYICFEHLFIIIFPINTENI